MTSICILSGGSRKRPEWANWTKVTCLSFICMVRRGLGPNIPGGLLHLLTADVLHGPVLRCFSPGNRVSSTLLLHPVPIFHFFRGAEDQTKRYCLHDRAIHCGPLFRLSESQNGEMGCAESCDVLYVGDFVFLKPLVSCNFGYCSL